MKTLLVFVTVSLAALSLTGCDKPRVTCLGQEGVSLIGQIITEAADKKLMEHKNGDGTSVFDAASVTATLGKIGISVENIRTAKEDPNSTKVVCEASIKITVPPDLLQDAEESRKLMETGPIAEQAKNASLEQSKNIFSKYIEYSVQPTDDGKKVFTQLSVADPIADFVYEVVGSAIMKPVVEKEKAQDAKAAEAEGLQAEQEQQKLQIETGESYSSVRVKMIAAGWQPYHSPEADDCNNDPRCEGRPEMEACAGTGMANCKFLWKKDSQTIGLCTVGEDAVFDGICSNQ